MMRPSWDKYWMEIVMAVRKRATCNRGQTACVITRDNQILATGYVGSIIGAPHCDDVGHWLIDGSCIRTLHAEANAIAQCAKLGIAIKDATLYCFLFPCLPCTKLIIQSGIIRVVSEFDYQKAELSKKFLETAGVEWTINRPQEYAYIN